MSGKNKKKKGQKLELGQLVSVDLCQQGANPDAHICLYKNADGTATPSDPKPPANTPTAETTLFEKFANYLVNAFKSTPNVFSDEQFEKDAMSFNNITARQEVDENLWKYLRAFSESVESIVKDGDLEAAQKTTKLNETLSQFSTKMQSLFPALVGVSVNDEPQEGVDKSKVEGDDNMDFNFDNIDKSKLTAEELATFEELAKKSMATPAVDNNTPPATPPAANPAPVVTEKAAPVAEETNPALAKALAEIADLKKNYEEGIEKQAKAEMLEIAKKYIPLGKKPEELADTLYSLKKSGEANYNAYVSALDANLELANKSNLFNEIGKSTHGDSGSNAEAKLTEIAKSFMTADPALSFNEAMVKACDENPVLRAEYEKQ